MLDVEYVKKAYTGVFPGLGFMGFICAGFLQHEGSHNALSHRQWVNTLGRYAIMPWADPAEWFRAHVATHHPYTNTVLDAEINQLLPNVSLFPGKKSASEGLFAKIALSIACIVAVPAKQVKVWSTGLEQRQRSSRRAWIRSHC